MKNTSNNFVLKEENRHVLQPYGMAIMRDDGKILTVNEVGADILSLLKSTKNLQKIINAISDLYDIEEQVLSEDINGFFEFALLNEIVKKTTSDTNVSAIEFKGSKNHTSIIQADIELTYSCAYKCSYCYVDKRDKSILRFDQWKSIIDELVEKGTMQISLTGGDPLLHPDFPSIIEYLNGYDLKVQVFTTGHGISRKNLQALLRSDLNFVHVSLDSLNKDRNDAHRVAIDGSSSTENTMDFINLLRKNDIPIAMGVLVKPGSMEEDLLEISNFAIQNEIKARFSGIVKRGVDNKIEYDSEILPANMYPELNRITESYDSKNKYLEFEPVGCTDNELLCKFPLGFIAIGPMGYIRPCLESDDFFKKQIPELANGWNDIFSFSTLEETSIFKYLSSIDPDSIPDPNGWCSRCPKITTCLGCILAGHHCKTKMERGEHNEEKKLCETSV